MTATDVSGGELPRDTAPTPGEAGVSPAAPRRWPLAAYVAVLLVLVGAVAVAATAYLSVQAERDARREAQRASAYAARTAATQLAEGVEVLRTTVARLAGNPQIPGAFREPAGCTLTFSAGGSFASGHLDLVRPDGSVACSSRAAAGGAPLVGYAGEDWLADVASGPLLETPVRDRATGRHVVLSAAPVPGGGAVAAFAELASVGGGLASLYGGGRPSVFLVVSADGRILAQSRDPGRWIGRRLASTPFVAPLDGAGGRDVEGRERIFGAATVAGAGWRVFVGEDEAAALAPGERLRDRQLLIIVGGLALVLLAAYLVFRSVTTPIRRLDAAVRAADPYDTPPPRIPVGGPAEVAALAEHVNRLVASVGAELEQRRRLEEQLRHAQKMDALGRVAAGIAHDFNNLVTVIGGFTRLMLRSVGPQDPLRAHAEEVGRAADRAASLIRQLLLFSRREVAKPAVLDLNEVVMGMEAMLRRVLGEQVQLSARVTADPATVRADRGQLEQVLLNLAVNARDAMPGGGTLVLKTTTAALDPAGADALALDPGLYVVVRVADDGIGMDARTRARLFEPFFTTKQAGQGTGLGLATCWGIVTQFGGRIDVESEPGAGSVFTLYLPAVADPAEAGTEPAPPEEAPAAAGATILLVEDDPGLRALAKTVLDDSGYTVLEARFGEEALFVADQHEGRIDVLLTDGIMPVMTGRQLAERFVALYPDAEVVFMSGYDRETGFGRDAPAAHAFLAKPFSPDELLATVRAALGERAELVTG